MIRENAIHLGDAIGLLEHVPDESIDLIICDGP